MAVSEIDLSKCNGCGICVNACPMDVLRMEGGRAKIVYPQECMCCDACEIDCPRNAIYVSPEKHDPIMVSWK
ncbi:MAG: 4Fe-4S dicluster domain-containing protein [Oscillospiraceae bacterium]|jgi:NAD-dependent dihydropyrimidine dehydrogenase PreA subunit